MIVLEKSGVITPDMDKTNIQFEFDLPGDVSAVIIDYSYSPKTLENEDEALRLISAALKKYEGAECGKDPHDFLPVNNLITISVDDPQGYRGAAHRQTNKQRIIIAEKNSTPGFVNREISAGKWRVMLNVHCCVCNVEYNLKISGGKENELSSM